MSDRYSSFTVAEGMPLSSDLGFLANTVIVDNVTASWLFMPNAGRYVPPFTYGATFPLGAGVQVAQAAWRTPPGVTAPTAGSGQAQLTFTDAVLAPSNGQPVVIPSQQVVLTPPPQASWTVSQASPPNITGNLVSFTVGPSGPGSSIAGDFAVPAGTNSLIIDGGTFSSNGSNQCTFSLTVTGKTTGTVYLAASSVVGTSQAPPQPPFACIVSPAADPVVTVRVAVNALFSNNAVTGTFEIVASFGTQAVAVEGVSGATPIPVVPTAAQRPGTVPSTALASIGASATVTMISGFSLIANRVLYAASISAGFGAAANGGMKLRARGQTSGNTYDIVGTSAVGGNNAIGYAQLQWPIDILSGMNSALDTLYDLQVVNLTAAGGFATVNVVTGLLVPGVWA